MQPLLSGGIQCARCGWFGESMKPQAKAKSPRGKILGALFKKAADLGISQEMVREVIAQEVNGKRLSASTLTEIGRVIDHVTGKPRQRKYAPGIAGLRHEIKDLAMSRWGDSWEESLNRFCEAFGLSHHRFVDITRGKAIKKRLLELNRKGAESAE